VPDAVPLVPDTCTSHAYDPAATCAVADAGADRVRVLPEVVQVNSRMVPEDAAD